MNLNGSDSCTSARVFRIKCSCTIVSGSSQIVIVPAYCCVVQFLSSQREAIASVKVLLGPEVFKLVSANGIKKVRKLVAAPCFMVGKHDGTAP